MTEFLDESEWTLYRKVLYQLAATSVIPAGKLKLPPIVALANLLVRLLSAFRSSTT